MSTSRRVVVLGWLALLGMTTAIRCGVWQSDLTLWTDALRTSPEKPRVVLNAGRSHELAGDEGYAEQAYRHVIQLTFDDRRTPYLRRFSQAAAETNLAHLDMKHGRLASAMRILDGTLRSWPEFPYAHYNKGAIFWVVGECDAAADEYRVALLLDPTLPKPGGTCTPAVP